MEIGKERRSTYMADTTISCNPSRKLMFVVKIILIVIYCLNLSILLNLKKKLKEA